MVITMRLNKEEKAAMTKAAGGQPIAVWAKDVLRAECGLTQGPAEEFVDTVIAKLDAEYGCNPPEDVILHAFRGRDELLYERACKAVPGKTDAHKRQRLHIMVGKAVRSHYNATATTRREAEPSDVIKSYSLLRFD